MSTDKNLKLPELSASAAWNPNSLRVNLHASSRWDDLDLHKQVARDDLYSAWCAPDTFNFGGKRDAARKTHGSNQTRLHIALPLKSIRKDLPI